MQTLNISLPDHLKDFVDGELGSGRYPTASEYVGELIHQDERRQAQEHLESLLLEGLESGEATELTPRDWEDIRREGIAQVELRKPQPSF